MPDAHKVHIYRTTISSPNPTTDSLIATENNVAQNGSWTETIGGWPTGVYYVYAIAEDLAGNTSDASTLIRVASFDANNFVSSTIGWKIGDFNQATIGQTSTGGGN